MQGQISRGMAQGVVEEEKLQTEKKLNKLSQQTDIDINTLRAYLVDANNLHLTIEDYIDKKKLADAEGFENVKDYIETKRLDEAIDPNQNMDGTEMILKGSKGGRRTRNKKRRGKGTRKGRKSRRVKRGRSRRINRTRR